MIFAFSCSSFASSLLPFSQNEKETENYHFQFSSILILEKEIWRRKLERLFFLIFIFISDSRSLFHSLIPPFEKEEERGREKKEKIRKLKRKEAKTNETVY